MTYKLNNKRYKIIRGERAFTWGFEIEGGFSTDLLDRLYRLGKKQNFAVIEKYDSSVDEDLWRTDDSDDSEGVSELAIGTFNSLKAMLKVLAEFKNDINYYQNNSCGIHIHMGFKRDIREYRKKLANYNVFREVEKFVYTKLGNRIRERIRYGDFCRQWIHFDTFYGAWKNHHKYEMVRNHPQGTLEFRFFSTLENRLEMIYRFFSYFLDLISKIDNKLYGTIKLPKLFSKTEIQNYDFRLEKQFNSINMDYQLPASKINRDFLLNLEIPE